MQSNQRRLCIILGGGGHAQVLIDSIQSGGLAKAYGVLDIDACRWGQELLGVPILGGDDLLPQLSDQGVNCFAVGLGSIGDNGPREHLFALGLAAGLEPLTVVHPAAICSKWARLNHGVQLFPGSIINAGAKLGANVIVNSGAIVEHDCILGDHTHVATGARLSGRVHIAKGAHIGTGATVLQSIRVGESAVVGAGAVVINDIPDHTTVVGIPAHPL